MSIPDHEIEDPGIDWLRDDQDDPDDEDDDPDDDDRTSDFDEDLYDRFRDRPYRQLEDE